MGEWSDVELSGLALAEPGVGGLRLRPYRPDDAPAVLAAMQDPVAAHYLPIPQPYTTDDAAWFCADAPARAAAGRGVQLAMTHGGDDVYVGGANLLLPDTRSLSAEIGYSVASPARGHGLAARAARLLAAWGFAHGLTRIELHIEVDNLPSLRSGLRAGFRFEGVRRGEIPGRNGPADTAALVRCATDPGEPVAPWLPPMTDVSDGVVRLRALGPDDAGPLALELADPVARAWQLGTPVTDPAATAAALALTAPLRWLVGPTTLVAVVDAASDEVAGHLQVRQTGPSGVLHLGYGVVPAFRGRGFTVRALRLFAAWAFHRADMHRVEFGVDVANGASLAVAARAGFVREGVGALRLPRPDGTLGDEIRFGLVRSGP